MKRFLLLAMLVAACIAFGAQQTITFHRTLKVGDADSYEMQMTEHLETSDATVDAAWTETIANIDKDGGATANVVYSNFHISANGIEIPARAPATEPIQFAGGGVNHGPLTTGSSVSHLFPDLFATYALNLPLAQDQEIKIDGVNGEGQKVMGTAKLSEVKDGKAKVALKLLLADKAEPQPMVVVATASYNVADSKLIAVEGTVSDLPTKLAGRYNVQSADFKVHRIGG